MTQGENRSWATGSSPGKPEDREARFNRLYLEHYAAVRAFAWRRARDLSDDIVAETFLVAWRRLDEAPAGELPWLLGVARRVWLNMAGREHRRWERETGNHRYSPSLEERAASAPAWPGNGGGLLAEAFERLSERDREVLLLIAWEGLDPQSVAQVLNCSRANVALRLFRARKRLAAALREVSPSPRPCRGAQENGVMP
jgi:RNA polymerase sigma-70 factor (ECF subfamily)